MANNKMPWFRLYSEVLDDKKIKRICRATGQSKALVLGVWVTLLALANDSGDRGSLQISDGIPYELGDIAYETDLPDDQVDTLLKLFEQYDMLHHDNKAGWAILNWDGRQFKSDNVAERVAKHRAKKEREEQSNDMKRYSNVIDTYTDTYTESESDTDIKGVKRPPLLIAFEAVTKIYQPAEMIEPKGFMLWEKEINKWEGMGVTKADIEAAVEKADELKTNLSWPGSITKYMESAIARRKRGVNGGAKQAQDATDLIMQMVEKGEI